MQAEASPAAATLDRAQDAVAWADEALADADIKTNLDNPLADERAGLGVEVVAAQHANGRPDRQH